MFRWSSFFSSNVIIMSHFLLSIRGLISQGQLKLLCYNRKPLWVAFSETLIFPFQGRFWDNTAPDLVNLVFHCYHQKTRHIPYFFSATFTMLFCLLQGYNMSSEAINTVGPWTIWVGGKAQCLTEVKIHITFNSPKTY